MTPPRRLAAALGAGALALGAAAALGQDRPESLLPPGFADPAPPLQPRATATPTPSATAGPTVQPLPLPDLSPTPTPSATPTPDAALLALYEMPLAARRSLALLGPAGPREGGVAADAFAGADGRFVEALMRRTAAPLPSRWLSILLRRTLASRLATPDRVDGADFAAERAWLLLRMGEAAAARAVVQGVDTADATPKLLQVAMNAMLATGDIAGLCPFKARASGEPGWTLARAMCASLAGDARDGARQIAAARRRRVASGIDLLLAQKVAGAGGTGRQAVTIEWDVAQLTSWRWGLATATGVAVPDALYDTVGPQVRHWRAAAAGVPVAQRMAVADAAAAAGVLSNLALVDLYGAVLDEEGAAAGDRGVAQDLATAYTDRAAAGRLAAMRAVWGAGPRIPYGRLVLTARAAARMPVAAEGDAGDPLVASLLSAGLDRAAARWRDAVPAGGDAWAMIALADPDVRGMLSYSDLASYAGTGDARAKQRLLFAGLAGLGRLEADDVERAAEALDVRIGTANSWTRALDRAAADGEAGTVVVLAAIGMQTGSWRGVPPETLYRIVGALRAVGYEGEARMIAAEAIARG